MKEEKRLDLCHSKFIEMEHGEKRDKLMDRYFKELHAYHAKCPDAKELYENPNRGPDPVFSIPRTLPRPFNGPSIQEMRDELASYATMKTLIKEKTLVDND